MNFINSLGNQTLKYFKGMFALAILWLIPAIGIFVFNSCQKVKHDNSKSGEAARKFNTALVEARKNLGSIDLSNNKSLQSVAAKTTEDYYLKVPAETDPKVIEDFNDTPTIEALTSLLENNGVSINDTTDTNYDAVIQVPEQQITTLLQPLVTEAKNYLIAKGATLQQIAEMLEEEKVKEIALIPFVKTLVAIEQSQVPVAKFTMPFVSEANALPKFLECGIEALGFDALYPLYQSTLSTWTWGTMKSVFKTVAKKFLGPIGVTIAVITFGLCMLR